MNKAYPLSQPWGTKPFLLAAPFATTKFNGNHKSAFLVTAKFTGWMMDTSGGTGVEDTEQGSMEAHPEALRLSPLTLHIRLQQGWEPTAHHSFIVPVWDRVLETRFFCLESDRPSDCCSKHYHDTPRNSFIWWHRLQSHDTVSAAEQTHRVLLQHERTKIVSVFRDWASGQIFQHSAYTTVVSVVHVTSGMLRKLAQNSDHMTKPDFWSAQRCKWTV